MAAARAAAASRANASSRRRPGDRESAFHSAPRLRSGEYPGLLGSELGLATAPGAEAIEPGIRVAIVPAAAATAPGTAVTQTASKRHCAATSHQPMISLHDLGADGRGHQTLSGAAGATAAGAKAAACLGAPTLSNDSEGGSDSFDIDPSPGRVSLPMPKSYRMGCQPRVYHRVCGYHLPDLIVRPRGHNRFMLCSCGWIVQLNATGRAWARQNARPAYVDRFAGEVGRHDAASACTNYACTGIIDHYRHRKRHCRRQAERQAAIISGDALLVKLTDNA